MSVFQYYLPVKQIALLYFSIPSIPVIIPIPIIPSFAFPLSILNFPSFHCLPNPLQSIIGVSIISFSIMSCLLFCPRYVPSYPDVSIPSIPVFIPIPIIPLIIPSFAFPLSILNFLSYWISLPFIKEARDLGVVMTSNLSWRSHVASISRRVHFSLYRLKFHRGALSVRLRKMLISSTIFLLLDYCCVVYNDLITHQ